MKPALKLSISWQEAKNYYSQHRVDLSGVTLKDYSFTLNRLFDKMPFNHVGRLHILKFLQEYDNPNTYNTNLYAIKSFFGWASDFYQIPNPSIGLKCKKLNKIPDVRILSEHEYRMVYNLTGHYRDVAVFLCNTGLRSSEFCSLRPEHCYTDHIVIVRKGGKIGTVPLNRTALDLLKIYDYKINYSLKKEHYFEHHNIKYICCALSVKLGLPKLNPHALRHFFATRLLNKGASIQDVSRLLGHSNINLTISRYYHPSGLADAVGLLDEI